ncbi:hypothetical protein SAMN05443999_109122 [Roseovarius azorensis]|uniref:Uncharacterized protein n=1 Tax=Roseovarius azorensis TaxID=1287727 RepID=A0A1H7U0Q8_9RHOB|nr:hypothetical protein [Roseovarius azorensis]SEL90523.1 hypothetical protein SAMN05443999_109122 [Roseovarius azorensis]
MRVIIHAGAHNTDEDRLLACLFENSDLLAQHGTHLPDPVQYRRVIRDIVQQAENGALMPQAREALREVLGDIRAANRLVLSNEGFFGTPRMAVGGGLFYRAAEQRLDLFRQMFPGDRIELFLGLRDPAGYLPALLARTNLAGMDDLLRGCDPDHMRWSELIGRIRNSHPEIALTVWCNEDTPLIWGRILRAMAGLPDGIDLAGEFALLPEIMSPAGAARFRDYMNRNPGLTDAQKGRVVEAFLDKFADHSALEEEFDVPAWTAETIATLTTLYDADVQHIRQMQGVRLILP